MTLAILFVIFLTVVIYLLYVPIILNIDTITNKYYLRVWGLAKASFEQHEVELFRIKFTLFYFKFYYYPLRSKRHKKQVQDKNKPSISSRWGLGLMDYFKLLKTFKLKKFELDVDTGDYTMNAKLIPIFLMLNTRVGGMHINYNGRNQLALRIENRPIYIIKKLITLKS